MGLSTDDGLKAISEKMKAQFEQESEMRKAILNGIDPEQAYLKFRKF